MKRLEGKLQQALLHLYRIDQVPAVHDFRIGRGYLEVLLGKEKAARHERETLLVADTQDETLIALFLDDNTIERAVLFAENGEQENLDAFCVVMEGVSHFVYFIYASEQDRPVSQAELELQAEIDKFLMLRLLFPHKVAEDLIAKLFDHFELVTLLTADEHYRYRLTNRVARRYARWWATKFARGNGAIALDDARRLYRKSFSSKLAHIARAA